MKEEDWKKAQEPMIEGLHGISDHVARHMRGKGIEKATGPQMLAFEPILNGKDVLLIAPTGFGKTEAVFAPYCRRSMDPVRKKEYSFYT